MKEWNCKERTNDDDTQDLYIQTQFDFFPNNLCLPNPQIVEILLSYGTVIAAIYSGRRKPQTLAIKVCHSLGLLYQEILARADDEIPVIVVLRSPLQDQLIQDHCSQGY